MWSMLTEGEEPAARAVRPISQVSGQSGEVPIVDVR